MARSRIWKGLSLHTIKSLVKPKSRSRSKYQTVQQTQSKLCTIPLEIRLMIWSCLITNTPIGVVLHMYENQHGSKYFICENACPNNQTCSWRYPCARALGVSSRYVDYAGNAHFSSQRALDVRRFDPKLVTASHPTFQLGRYGFSGILRSCRELHDELTQFLYKRFHFHFPDPFSLPTLTSCLSPTALNHISMLTIDWTDCPCYSSPALLTCQHKGIWPIIASMQGLRDFQAYLKLQNFDRSTAPGIALVNAMQGLKNFDNLERIAIVVDDWGERDFWRGALLHLLGSIKIIESGATAVNVNRSKGEFSHNCTP